VVNKRMMKSIIAAIVFILSNNIVFAQNKIADKIVGIVDNKIVLQSDVQTQLNQMASQGAAMNADSRCYVYQQMMLQKLMVAQANHDSVVVSNDEIENELDRRMNYFIGQVGSKEKFEEYYHKPILKFKEEFREAVQEQLLAQRMQQKITADSKVSPMEVKKYFENIPTDSLPYINAEYEIGEIIIAPKVSAESRLATKKLLLEIKEKIVSGVSFDSQAKLYSEDPGSAIKGGDLGLVGRGQMVPEFESALFKLKDGELSDIVETQYGYHLIKMTAKQGEKAKAKHILLVPKTGIEELTAALLKLDTIRKKIIADSITFKKAADKYSTDEATKTNGGLVQNPNDGNSLLDAQLVEPDLFFVVDSMKIGQISKPIIYKTFDGKEAARIVYLKTKTMPHKANLNDDYAKLQQAAISKKQQQKMLDWMKRTTAKNYIIIDDEYKKCSTMQDWIKEN
jgi:peptidyl-prolyl cis-trans isomerase SurA